MFQIIIMIICFNPR